MDNTTWLFLAIVAALASALTTFSDNYITDVLFKGRRPQAQKVFFGVAYILTAIMIVLLFPIHKVSILVMLGLIGAGAISGFASIPYYLALGKDDSTNVTILQQLSPIFYLILGRILLGEEIAGEQLVAFMVVLVAPLIVVLSTKGKRREAKIRNVGLIIINTLVSALAGTLIVKFGGNCDFATMLFFIAIGKGLTDVGLTIALKSWRKRFRDVMRRRHSMKFWVTFISNHCLWLISDFTYYIALSLAPAVAMASAVTKTLHPIMVFSFGVVLSVLWPNFGREKVKRKAILTHLTATAVAVVGIILMQIL